MLVRTVVNGGAIDVTAVGRVRLRGITAPRVPTARTDGAPFGIEARERLVSLVGNRYVRLEFDSAARTRGAADVLLEDGTYVNAVLVREGLARVSGAAGPRAAELRAAEAEAQAAHRGIWGSAASAADEHRPLKLPSAKRKRKGGGGRRAAAPRGVSRYSARVSR